MSNKKLVMFGMFILVLLIGMTFTVSYAFNRYGEVIEIHFYTNGGSELENVYYTYGKDKLLEILPVPTKEGYIFKGWFVDKTLETKFKSYPTPNFENNTIVHLYAKWGLPEEESKTLLHPLLIASLCICGLIVIVVRNMKLKIKEIQELEEQK